MRSLIWLSGLGARHFTTEAGAATTFLGAGSAQRVMRRMLLADFGAGVADFRAKAADIFGERRDSAHPLRRQRTDIRAFSTETDAAGHHLHVVSM